MCNLAVSRTLESLNNFNFGKWQVLHLICNTNVFSFDFYDA